MFLNLRFFQRLSKTSKLVVSAVKTVLYGFPERNSIINIGQPHECKEVLYLILCTGAFLYVPYSFLLISNKFCNGREQCGYVT
jgi:hypothetical protein